MEDRSRTVIVSVAALTAVLALGGCGPCKPKPPAPGACVAPTIDLDRSLVVHDPALLGPGFALRRTLQQMIDTSGGSTTPEALLQSMLDSFGKTSFVQPLSGRTLPVDQRTQEKNLPVAQLLEPTSPNGMAPTGLFNRLDLAPADGSNCGEYRIVYAKRSSGPLDRFLMIFEAKLPNPDAASGLKGCKPVAEFWAELSKNPNAAQRVAALEKFYYAGLPSFSPVVTYANYGVPFGQVRTNLFVSQPTFQPWLLREHRTDPGSTVPLFVVDTVKQNPLAEWYRLPGTLPPGVTLADQQAFRAHFLNTPVCNLVQPDRGIPGATEFQIVNNIGAGFDPAGDEFQSVSSDDSDNPAVDTDPALVTAVTTRLSALTPGSVGAPELLNRAGAMTCGGCHQFSNGTALGNGATWPNSGQFVHIDENGTLSPALVQFFLPRRREILARFVCDPSAESRPQPSCPSMPEGAPRAVMARLAAAPPSPDATLAADSGLDAEAIARLTRGRTTATLQQIDTARLALRGASRQARALSPARAAVSRRTVSKAEQTLRALVERARLEEQALPGAFVPVRRTH